MEVVVRTPKGVVQGIATEYVNIFKGIPYAKPPVGEFRFRAPQSCDTWEDVWKADHFRFRSWQIPEEKGSFYYKEFFSDKEYVPEMNEDCLYLNIWAPSNAEGKCPVAIWYHGGAFIAGHSSEIEFSGEEYAKRGVILVTVTYRLGMLGYFCHPELTKRDGHSGNYGLLDQIAAIDWVRDNIAVFGGDPENITIFGQSAGAMSVRCLVTSPLVEGKVQRAILQSGNGYGGVLKVDFTMEKMQKLYADFLEKNNLTLEMVQQMLPEKVVHLGAEFNQFAFPETGTWLSMTPVIDNYALTMFGDDAVDQAKTLRIPYMIGVTKNDIAVSPEGVEDPDKNELLQSAVKWAQKHTDQGLECYVYYFKRDLPGDDAGAFHSGELWYVFGTLGRCWRPMERHDYELSEKILDYWTSFMKKSDPGWSRYTEKNAYIKILE